MIQNNSGGELIQHWSSFICLAPPSVYALNDVSHSPFVIECFFYPICFWLCQSTGSMIEGEEGESQIWLAVFPLLLLWVTYSLYYQHHRSATGCPLRVRISSLSLSLFYSQLFFPSPLHQLSPQTRLDYALIPHVSILFFLFPSTLHSSHSVSICFTSVGLCWPIFLQDVYKVWSVPSFWVSGTGWERVSPLNFSPSCPAATCAVKGSREWP